MRSPSSFTITTLMSWHNLKIILYPLSFYTKKKDAFAGKKFLDSLFVDQWKYFSLLYTEEFTLLWSQFDLLKVEIRHIQTYSCLNKYLEMIKLQEDNYFIIRCWFPWMPLSAASNIGPAKHVLDISCYFGYEWVLNKYRTILQELPVHLSQIFFSPMLYYCNQPLKRADHFSGEMIFLWKELTGWVDVCHPKMLF